MKAIPLFVRESILFFRSVILIKSTAEQIANIRTHERISNAMCLPGSESGADGNFMLRIEELNNGWQCKR